LAALGAKPPHLHDFRSSAFHRGVREIRACVPDRLLPNDRPNTNHRIVCGVGLAQLRLAVAQALTPQGFLRRNRDAARQSRAIRTNVGEEVERVVRLRVEEEVGIGANAVEQRRDLFGWNRFDGEVSCGVVLPP
jgi:hypothetical protein